jgi:Uma2 family endonuclease
MKATSYLGKEKNMQQLTTEGSKQLLPFPVSIDIEDDSNKPHPRKWTKEEYYRLAELGFFEGKRTELIEGEIIEMPTMKSPHAVAVGLTDDILRQIFAGNFAVRSQMPIDFGDNELVPDAAVVTGKTRDYKDAHPKTAVLVVEVADTTLWHDRNRKLKLYALNKIPEYWILNIPERSLEVYRRPMENEFKDVSIHSESESVSPIAMPDALIKVADLLP